MNVCVCSVFWTTRFCLYQVVSCTPSSVLSENGVESPHHTLFGRVRTRRGT